MDDVRIIRRMVSETRDTIERTRKERLLNSAMKTSWA
jgi:hypothetical protein